MALSSLPRPKAPALRRSTREREGGSPVRTVGATVLLWLLAVLYGFPCCGSSCRPSSPRRPLLLPPDAAAEDLDLRRYEQAWTSFNFAGYFANTLIVAVSTTVLTVVASAMTGYALAKYQNWWLKAFFLCILATTMLPTEVILSPSFLVIRDLGLYNHLAGIVVPSIITATGCFMFRQFFSTVPNELLEAARIDGSNELTTFVRVMLPIARPIMITLAIFSFQWRWNDYIWPLIVLNDPSKFTLQIGIQSIVGRRTSTGRCCWAPRSSRSSRSSSSTSCSSATS